MNEMSVLTQRQDKRFKAIVWKADEIKIVFSGRLLLLDVISTFQNQQVLQSGERKNYDKQVT